MDIRTKRIHDPAAPDDGIRILVDGLWPRGIAKGAARLDRWMKEAAPTAALRKWYGHDPEKWPEFERRFAAELDARPGVIRSLLKLADGRRVTLLTAARDREHSHAVALKHYLERAAAETRADAADPPS
ncbi:MAG: DUF488 family protein [Alphaproteobacteria bacterium]|jgi:uncharacterized protein YeaO (DUF488 family)|nr:DUF488 family protein [Alphaproteobacteria bacterium]